jgi:hypothetical protein
MDSHYWSDWMGKFQRGHFTSVILALLDGGGPLKMILAQGMLAFTPFLGVSEDSSWQAFAEMLEDPASSRLFAAYLHQENL